MDIFLILIIIITYLLFKEIKKNDSSYYGNQNPTNNHKTFNNQNNNVNYNSYQSTSSSQNINFDSGYKRANSLLTPAEKKFFDSLVLALSDSHYFICPKVRLADVLVVSEIQNWGTHFNKIKSKHIDFLLCDKSSMIPMIVIELDDKSHLRKDRIERDEFFNKVLRDNGIHVIRQNVSYAYDINLIRNKINSYY